jgi:hypothetical protein
VNSEFIASAGHFLAAAAGLILNAEAANLFATGCFHQRRRKGSASARIERTDDAKDPSFAISEVLT